MSPANGVKANSLDLLKLDKRGAARRIHVYGRLGLCAGRCAAVRPAAMSQVVGTVDDRR